MQQSNIPEQIEVLVEQKKNLVTKKPWNKKILNLAVNTEYDQKEQMFRNFLGSIGPLSSPVLSYEFDAGAIMPQNMTILWLDPMDRVADVNYIVDESMAVRIESNFII